MFAQTLNVFRTKGIGAAIHFHLKSKAEDKTHRSFSLSRTDSGSLSMIRRRVTGTQHAPVGQPIDYTALNLPLETVAFVDYLTHVQDFLVSRQREARAYVFKIEFNRDVATTAYYRIITYRAGKELTKLSQVEIHGLS
jgi:hypothetical protein